ncbi:MAG: terminase small subunit [Firmicutes bacterium]|nr:terminase small subunit [Bacillota bacterium]
MARAPNPKVGKAKALFLQGKKLKEIAELLGEPEGTVRRWKSTYKWGEKENERSESKTNVRNPKKRIEPEVEELMDSDLNETQKLFCLFYSKNFNATKAYQKAYECSYATALTNGPALLGNTRIREEVSRLKKMRYSKAMLEPEDIFEKYMEIAFSDITDYVEFGQKEQLVIGMYGPIKVKDSKTGEESYLKETINVVYAKHSAEVDGSLISEVSQGRNGFKIKLQDKQKALSWLADHMDMATEEQRARIDHIKAATSKIRGEDAETEHEDDGFLEALKGEVEPWEE